MTQILEPNWLDKMRCVYGNKVYDLGYNGVETRYISAEPKKIIFNGPATIVYWSDKTKTVVKCDYWDTFDPIEGFLYCVAKKYFGNNNNFNKRLHKISEALEEIEENGVETDVDNHYINVMIDLDK